MRRFWIAACLLAFACPLAGCDDTSSKPVAPEEAKAGLDYVKKANPGPMSKGGAPGAKGTKN